MKKSYGSNLRRWTILSLWSVACTTALAACGSDDEGSKVGNGPPAGGSNNVGTGGSAAGSNTTTGGTSSSTGGTGNSTSTGGTSSTGTGGSSVNNLPTKACPGLPFNAAAGAGGEQACQGVSSEAEAVDVDLFMIMDRSVSMGYEASPGVTRWDAIKAAIDEFAKSPQAEQLRGGIGFFNLSGSQDDAIDCDASKYATPKVAIAPMTEAGPQMVAAMNALQPGGLTPTVPALRGALEHAKAWAAANPNHATVVALVTDGYPTQCSETSPSDVSKVAEEAYLNSRIRTFVVGVGEVAKFNLDNYARAGGTREAYVVEDADAAASFTRALNNITNSQITCEYEIPPPPSNDEQIDFEKVSVLYAPNNLPQEEVPRVESLAACSRNPNGGWFFDNPANPKKILVCPCTCANFGAGRVDVRLGCSPSIGIR